MNSWTVRKFQSDDAPEVSSLICRNLYEVNSRDYPKEEIERLAAAYGAEHILKLASQVHLYVACSAYAVIGCGAVAKCKREETTLLKTIFVLPEYHGKGVGKGIIRALERDEWFLESKRTELSASVTACGFYEKLGYQYFAGDKRADQNRLYRMVKYHAAVEK